MCLDSNQETLKTLEFRTCSRTTLRIYIYDPSSYSLTREVKYEPNKEKVWEVLHDDFKRIHIIWRSNTHETKSWTEIKRAECAIL